MVASKGFGGREEYARRDKVCMWELIFHEDLEKALVFRTPMDAYYWILKYPNWIADGGAQIVPLVAPTSGWAGRSSYAPAARERIRAYAAENPPQSKRVAKRLEELRLEVGAPT